MRDPGDDSADGGSFEVGVVTGRPAGGYHMQDKVKGSNCMAVAGGNVVVRRIELMWRILRLLYMIWIWLWMVLDGFCW